MREAYVCLFTNLVHYEVIMNRRGEYTRSSTPSQTSRAAIVVGIGFAAAGLLLAPVIAIVGGASLAAVVSGLRKKR